jgi:hypothetical protein
MIMNHETHKTHEMKHFGVRRQPAEAKRSEDWSDSGDGAIGWRGALGCSTRFPKAVSRSACHLSPKRQAFDGDLRIARSVWSAPSSAALSGGRRAWKGG